MKRILLLGITLLLICSSYTVFSQNVAITDDNGYTADPSAMLDIKATTKGMLVPRLTTIQRTSVSSPATGLLVFDTNEGNFYFYNGSSWVNLSSGNPSGIWSQNGNNIYLSDTLYNIGIGTTNPLGKLEVRGDVALSSDEPLFEVINSNGDTVFAVYSQGVHIRVGDDPLVKAGASKGGFAVGGFSLSKNMTNEYMRVTPDSIRMYVEEGSIVKGSASKGGFAVGGFSISKGSLTNEYLRVTDDSVRVYIDDNPAKGSASKGGFAVGGFSISKSMPQDYFNISGADTAETIDPSEARMVWYPTKNALLAGQVLIEDADSVGTNSFASGYESKAIGKYSQALGYKARAFADNSTAIGNQPNAIGRNSFALGDSVYASGISSYALGAVMRNSLGVAIGSPTKATGDYSIAIGLGSEAQAIGAFAAGTNTFASGGHSTAMGYGTTASGTSSVSMGYQTTASGANSVSMGYQTTASGISSIALCQNSLATGNYSIAMGSGASATDYKATAIGWNTNAYGTQATAIGPQAKANFFSTAIGYLSEATGSYSVALGPSCKSTGTYGPTSLGIGSISSGDYGAMALGSYATASGSYGAIAMGANCTASGNYSIAMGMGIEAQGLYSVGVALSNQTGTIVANDNTMAIMGGNVGIGTVSPTFLLEVAGSANINSGLSSGIALEVNNVDALSYNAGQFTWGNGGSGNYFPDYVGIGTSPARRLDVAETAAPCARFHRFFDGSIIEFQSGGITEGTISISGTTTSYNAFTGSHYTTVEGKAEKGLVMQLTGDNTYLHNNKNGEMVYGVTLSSEPNAANIIGAYLGEEDFDGANSPSLVMAVGNGVMWVVDNGSDITVGDYLISASIEGHAMKDNGQYEIANIIARVAEPIEWKNVTTIINGQKHKLVSVFFENFKLYHNDKKLNELETRIKELEQLIKSSSSNTF